MIQRIQSLYMLLAAALMALMIFFPLGWIVAGAEEFKLLAFGMMHVSGPGAIQVVAPTLGLGIVTAAAALLPFVTIFLFRNRLLQYRLCMAEFALLLGAQIIALLFFFKLGRIFSEEFAMSSTSVGIPMFFPILAMILNGLAIRGIKKDISLIKSLDRIR